MNVKDRPNGEAPLPKVGNNGNKGGKVARAWQHVWDQLSHTEPREAIELAVEAGERFELAPNSVLAHMHRMAHDGFLAVSHRKVPTTVQREVELKDGTVKVVSFNASRNRTFYTIAER